MKHVLVIILFSPLFAQVATGQEASAELGELAPIADGAEDLDALDISVDEKKVVEVGREDLGDIWNSTAVFGDDIAPSGTDITKQIIVEQILEPEGEYRYAAFGKADPFLPPYELLSGMTQTTSTSENGESKSVVRGPSGEEIAITSPLQTELSNLSVIGMWQLDDGTRKALISNGAGQAVVAEVGDPIGYTGRVNEIRPEGLITRQYRLREDGSREYEDILLLFGDKDELLKSQIGTRVVLTPGGGAKVKENGPKTISNGSRGSLENKDNNNVNMDFQNPRMQEMIKAGLKANNAVVPGQIPGGAGQPTPIQGGQPPPGQPAAQPEAVNQPAANDPFEKRRSMFNDNGGSAGGVQLKPVAPAVAPATPATQMAPGTVQQ